MKILGIILAVLMLAGTAFVGLAAAHKSHALAADLANVTKGLTADQIEEAGRSEGMEIPSHGRLDGGALVGLAGGIGAVVLLIAAFAKKPWVLALSAVTVGCTAISAAVYPYVKTGGMDGAAPRSLALVALVLAVVGAGGALLAARPKAS